jgi:hypothetical protein
MKKPSKAQLSKELKDLGVEYDKASTQEQLQKLLDQTMGFETEDEVITLVKEEVIVPKKDEKPKACGGIAFNAGLIAYKAQKKLDREAGK